MIYGKLVGGALHGAPRPIRTENGDVFTTDPALLLHYGYKPIITAEYPSDGKYYTDSSKWGVARFVKNKDVKK